MLTLHIWMKQDSHISPLPSGSLLYIRFLSFRFPRLSIIHKKVDDYTFDLISFDVSNPERTIEKCLYFFFSYF